MMPRLEKRIHQLSMNGAAAMSVMLSACTIVNNTGAGGGAGGGQTTSADAGVQSPMGSGGSGAGTAGSGGGSTADAAGPAAEAGRASADAGTGRDDGGSPEANAAIVGASADAAAGGDAAAGDAAGGDAAAGTSTVNCTLPAASGPANAIASTAQGGLWNNPNTWAGGKIPSPSDQVVIASEVQVDGDPGDAAATCAGVTITATGVLRAATYSARTLIVNGDFVNYGAVRNGPPYASYDDATLEVRIGGRFFQEGSYGVLSTHFIGKQDQAIGAGSTTSLSGTFVDDDPTSAIRACTSLSSGGMALTLGTADAARGTLDLGDQTLTLSAGDFKITNGILRASKIVGVAGATVNVDRITAVGTLTLDGDIRTDASTISGSVKVLASGVLYNVSNATPTLVVNGSLENAGIVRRGPGYAAYGEGDLLIDLSGDLVQNGAYSPTATRFTGTSTQTITQAAGQTLSGPFTDTTPTTSIVAGSDLTFGGAIINLGGGTLEMGTKVLTLSSGDFKVSGGVVRASKIVGVAGATMSIPHIVAVGALALDGDVRTDASVIDGSVNVMATGVLYNVANAAPTLTINGSLENAGTVRRGPGYAAYGEGDLTIELKGDLIQNGPYTPTSTLLSGTAAQTISLGASQILSGSFVDKTPSSPIVAGSDFLVNGATIDLGADGTLDLGSHALSHPTGDLKIATGTLKANDITGGTDNSGTFTIAAIAPNSGTLTLRQHYPTSSLTIAGNLAVVSGAHLYNEYNVEAHVTVSGTVTESGTIGSGPGYASYDTGSLYLNGLKREGW